MTDSNEIDPIDRCRRFKQTLLKATEQQAEKQHSRLLVDACRELAPLFGYSAQEINNIWFECNDHEEDPLFAFQAEMIERGMQSVAVPTEIPEPLPAPGAKKKRGRKKKKKVDNLWELITDVQETAIWRQFVSNIQQGNGLVLLVFKPEGSQRHWIMTNWESAVEPQSYRGRIVIPISGAPDVCIMPLKSYLEENL